MSRTPLLLPPSLEEVKLQAAKIALPEHEAEKFWNYYESQGWKVGKNRMAVWTNALMGWKLRWQETNVPINQPGRNQPLTGVQMMVHRDEFERIRLRIADLKNNQTPGRWNPIHFQEYARLIERRNELKKMLGIVI